MNRFSNQVELTGKDAVRLEQLIADGKLKHHRRQSTGCRGCDERQEATGCKTALCREHERQYAQWYKEIEEAMNQERTR
jgi:hypothetical protein